MSSLDSPTLAAVIPAWNERPRITRLIRELVPHVDEVCVADAYSPDGTAQAARTAGASVVQSHKGRGAQLAAGVEKTTAEALVFVHADTRIPNDFGNAIRAALRNEAVVGGNFSVDYGPGRVARTFSFAGRLRQRALGLFYGDSCIFARRNAYRAIGGIRPQPLFEDLQFARDLAKRGQLHWIRSSTVTSSARRFRERPLRTVALWLALQVGYDLGVSPQALARMYRDVT